ncbi:cellulose synthase-like protein H1 isoform X4 [Pyrus x bretschneideri]|uniref:cellulose synthase-like protein H1 isoform X4 n=1 Tax=Pyrus x bretschneideri TaxID=225117 RepID=UPI00202EE4F6|nr:cellulose synthase-like protein H1 isoform X4 [Pyrus x bretschneideri]
MANQNSLPLHERIELRYTLHKVIEFIILFLLLSLLVHRLLSFNDHGFTWLIAFLCELSFTLNWVITISNKWNIVEYKTYPDRLLQRVSKHELPPVDMFVTTANSELEPPIITINTVLSLLAVDYPTNKLACYVSDDGCSPLTFYSLSEASKFAKLWVPFCKKYNVQVRAPFRYFSNNNTTFSSNDSSEFKQEWTLLKDEYEQLSRKIEDAVGQSIPFDVSQDFAVFSNVERNNHPTIIKVLWENKEDASDGPPHLVYISREKRPKHPHHSKAGAMNVLTRVSGLMTNAPFMLNVDCDMFVNNPNIMLQAMCALLGSENETKNAFAQFPQIFYDGLKDDPFGNQMVVLMKFVGHGIAGIQGPIYAGTGCVHRRKVIYGLSPTDTKTGERYPNIGSVEMLKTFGTSEEFSKSAGDALQGNTECIRMSSKSIEAAHRVGECEYEYGTNWGIKGQEPTYYIPVALFVLYHIYTLLEHLETGLSIRAWWNNQRMGRIIVMSAWLFGFIGVILKLLGISETVFEVTRKNQSTSSDEGSKDSEAGRFTFDTSPIFVPPTTILLVQLTALATAFLGLRPQDQDKLGSGPLEVISSVWLVLCLWPFLKGLFGTGKYGIPLSTIFKSVGFTLLFYTLCRN